MDKCRICLLNKNYLRPINELREGISYASMLTCVADIKVAEENNEVLCHLCSQKLRDNYNFKLLIIRSNKELNVNSKVFKFDCIKDIKDQILKQNSSPCSNLDKINNNPLLKLRNDTFYDDTLTGRLEISKEKLTAIYNLEIESEDTYEDIPNDSESNEKENYNEKNKETEIEIKRDINKKSDKIWKKAQIFKKVLIKPKYLEDLRLVPSEVILRGHKTPPNETGKREDISRERFECDECSKTFSTKPILRRHVKRHFSEEVFKCEICVATFNNKASLSRHLHIHSDIKNHKCNICNKTYRWRNSLHRHILIHNMNAKSHTCEFCNRSFLYKEGLNVHLRIHTGERPYSCEICLITYNNKCYFNKHCLKTHGVFLDGRSVYVMDEETLRREKVLMRDLMLHVRGVPTEREPLDSFKGRHKVRAFQKAVKAMKERKIPVDI